MVERDGDRGIASGRAGVGGGGGGGGTSEGGVKTDIPAVFPWSLMISLRAVAAP